MASLSMVPSALRRSLAPQQTCQLCAKRLASKSARAKRRPKVEVELTAAVDKLGLPGQRVQVAPGRMRNHLYPSKMALYVLGGRTMRLDGTLIDAPNSLPSSSPNSAAAASSTSPIITSRQIVDEIEKLGPLRFERLTTGQDAIHGSVTAQNVLAELQQRGVPITQLEGDWQTSAASESAIQQGKVKRLGHYIFNARIHPTTLPIVVQVVEASSS